MIDPAQFADLPGLLGVPRFDRYLRSARGDRARAIRLYAWNSEIASAFWGPLGCLEIVVRNAIHDALRSGRRDDWWNAPDVSLMDRERRAIDSAQQTLTRRGTGAPTAGDVVAATSLGFWVGLTDAGIPRHPHLSYETALWQPRVRRAFPGLGTVRRKQLHRKLDEVRRFRNRLAHHEPVFAAPLARVRDDVLEIAGFVHPDAHGFIDGAHRIDEVLARRSDVVDRGRAVI